jgi:hypothetical protein
MPAALALAISSAQRSVHFPTLSGVGASSAAASAS